METEYRNEGVFGDLRKFSFSIEVAKKKFLKVRLPHTKILIGSEKVK